MSSSVSPEETLAKRQLLQQAGIRPTNRARLMSYPLDDLRRAIAIAQERAELSLDGYLIAILRRGFFEGVDTPRPQPAPSAQEKPAAQGRQEAALQPQLDEELAERFRLNDRDGRKRRLFEQLGLRLQQYADYISYSVEDIQRASDAARRQQARHPGSYALAILRKKPAPPLNTIDYDQLISSWRPDTAPAPYDEQRERWKDVSRATLATMGAKQLWYALQDTYVSFDPDQRELTLQRDRFPIRISDAFIQEFVQRLELMTRNIDEQDKDRRFSARVRLI